MNDKDLALIDQKLTALLALTALQVSGAPREARPKLEILLRDVGLDVTTIAKVLGKKPNAVTMAVLRAKK